MRTLIIPCAGSRMNNGLPLFLNRHPKGELNAVQAMKGIFPENYDRIIFVVLESTEQEYDAARKLIDCVNSRWSVEVLKLKDATNGPAETVYQTLIIAEVEGAFAVRDSHAYIAVDRDYTGNIIAGLDLTSYERTVDKLRSKSFVTMNEQGQVLDIVEKHFSSDIISTGLYGFKRVEDFKLAYEHLQDPAYGITKLYISHIISYLIGYKQRVFHTILVKEFEDWSTPAAWQRIQKKYGLYFVDLDSVIIAGLNSEMALDEKAVKTMKRMIADGADIVGVTRGKMIDEKILSVLANAEVYIRNVINVETYSSEKLFIGSIGDLERVAVEI